MRKKILLVAASAVLLVFGFQNCSQKSSNEASPAANPVALNPTTPATTPTTMTRSTKILKEYKSKSNGKYFLTGKSSDQAIVENSGLFDVKGTITVFDTQDQTYNLPICRFWSTITQSHFYTVDLNLCASLKINSSFVDEGIEGYAVSVMGNGYCAQGLAPVYRLFTGAISPETARTHRFTGSVLEKQNLVNSGWIDEAVAFCVVDASTIE